MSYFNSLFPMFSHLLIPGLFGAMLIEFIIVSLLLLTALYFADKYRLPLKITCFNKVSPCPAHANFFYWLVLSSAVYLFIKILIYCLAFTSLPAKIVKIEQFEYNATLYTSSRPPVRHTSTREKNIPVLEVEIKGKTETYQFEQSFPRDSFKVGDSVPIVYITVWGEASYQGYGGIFFFRHDTILFLLLLSLGFFIRGIDNTSPTTASVPNLKQLAIEKIAMGLIGAWLMLSLLKFGIFLVYVVIRFFSNLFFPYF